MINLRDVSKVTSSNERDEGYLQILLFTLLIYKFINLIFTIGYFHLIKNITISIITELRNVTQSFLKTV